MFHFCKPWKQWNIELKWVNKRMEFSIITPCIMHNCLSLTTPFQLTTWLENPIENQKNDASDVNLVSLYLTLNIFQTFSLVFLLFTSSMYLLVGLPGNHKKNPSVNNLPGSPLNLSNEYWNYLTHPTETLLSPKKKTFS